jgi:hypothetical protein
MRKWDETVLVVERQYAVLLSRYSHGYRDFNHPSLRKDTQFGHDL